MASPPRAIGSRTPMLNTNAGCVARAPNAEPRASARETCEGSVGTDAAATHIDCLDTCTSPDHEPSDPFAIG
jgi:hypothetical protein